MSGGDLDRESASTELRLLCSTTPCGSSMPVWLRLEGGEYRQCPNNGRGTVAINL